MRPMFDPIAKRVPAATRGEARVEHFTVSETQSQLTALRAGEYTPPGRYARLYVNDVLMMTDTRHEHVSNIEVVMRSRGRVLIAGLGLGLIVYPIARKPDVASVTIVEKSSDVIALVAPHLPKRKVRVVRGDIFEYNPATTFHAIYFDIWPGITTDNLPAMARLHRRFARYRAPGGWMSSWQYEHLLRIRRSERRAEPWRAVMGRCGFAQPRSPRC